MGKNWNEFRRRIEKNSENRRPDKKIRWKFETVGKRTFVKVIESEGTKYEFW